MRCFPPVQPGLRGPLEGMDKVHAKFAHLRETKRQAEEEERARAELEETL